MRSAQSGQSLNPAFEKEQNVGENGGLHRPSGDKLQQRPRKSDDECQASERLRNLDLCTHSISKDPPECAVQVDLPS